MVRKVGVDGGFRNLFTIAGGGEFKLLARGRNSDIQKERVTRLRMFGLKENKSQENPGED